MHAGLVGRHTQVNLDLARAHAMTRRTRPRSTSCWPPNGSARSWSATTRPPGTSSPSCCAASTARQRQSCGLSRAAPACSDPHFRAVPRPQRDPGSVPSQRCGQFHRLLPSLIAGHMRRTPGGTKWRNERAGCGWYLTNTTGRFA
jgi:hypothetical protein